MKKIYFLLFCIFLSLQFASSQVKQKHYDHWIFGQMAGITFNTPDLEPVNVLIPIDYKLDEGTASKSDDDGNLIYTNFQRGFITFSLPDWRGIDDSWNVYFSSNMTHNSLIVEDFNDSKTSFVFTISHKDNFFSSPFRSLYYSKVDHNQNSHTGNNNTFNVGAVTEFNRLLVDDVVEKMAGVMNVRDNFFWLITHKANSNEFVVIKIDENGISNNPITQQIGEIHSSVNNFYKKGRISLSANGTTMALAVPYNKETNQTDPEKQSTIEVFNFDPETAEISNPRVIEFNGLVYSATLSANGKRLYVKTSNEVFQYNLDFKDWQDVLNSITQIHIGNFQFFEAMERGPNGKIYSVNAFDINLDVIHNPDEIGVACNYKDDEFRLIGSCLFGLPTVVNSFFTGEYDYKEEIASDVDFEIHFPKFHCYGDSISIYVKSSEEINYNLKIRILGPNLVYEFSSDEFANIEGSYKEYRIPSFQRNQLGWRVNPLIEVFYESGVNLLDSISFDRVSMRLCCPNNTFIENGRFNEMYVNPALCIPVNFETDFEFIESFPTCGVFNSKGQIQRAYSLLPSSPFSAKSRTTGLLYGDPIPNTPQRAWFQQNATSIGTRYRFSAYVSNIEFDARDGRFDGKSLDFKLGFRNYDGTDEFFAVLDNVQFELSPDTSNTWILMAGEFTAKWNTTQLAIWVEGKDEQNLQSFGFAITDLDLEPLYEYGITMINQIEKCADETVEFDVVFEGEIGSVRWSPATDLDNPNILNPKCNSPTSNIYTLTIIDKYGCEYRDSVMVNIEDCAEICFPEISVFLPDTTVDVGSIVCLEGQYLIECNEEERLPKEILIPLNYNPQLLKVVSASLPFQIENIAGEFYIVLELTEETIEIFTQMTFEICFQTFLSDKNISEIIPIEHSSARLIEKRDGRIRYESCVLPLRNIQFLVRTDFVANINSNNELEIFLTTKEQGLFKIQVIDLQGNRLIDVDYNNTPAEIKNELIKTLDISGYASGTYLIRLISPSRNVVTRRVIIVN